MNSMRSRLLIWLSVGLVLATLLGGGLIYRQALADANELFDYQLRQLAAALPNQVFSPMAPGRPAVIDIDEDIVIQIWDNTGLRLYYSHGQAPLPDRATLGFSDIYANNRLWRVYSTRLGNTLVQVAQPHLNGVHTVFAAMRDGWDIPCLIDGGDLIDSIRIVRFPSKSPAGVAAAKQAGAYKR